MKSILRISIISLLVVLFVQSNIFAENEKPNGEKKKTVKLQGKIIDKETGEALTGVKIFVNGEEKTVYSDFDGEFQLDALVSDDSQVTVTLISYEVKKIAIGESQLGVIELKRVE